MASLNKDKIMLPVYRHDNKRKLAHNTSTVDKNKRSLRSPVCIFSKATRKDKIIIVSLLSRKTSNRRKKLIHN